VKKKIEKENAAWVTTRAQRSKKKSIDRKKERDKMVIKKQQKQ